MPETIDAAPEDVTEETDNLPVPAPAASPTLFRTDDPGEIVQRATAVADELSKVLKDRNLTTNIQGREHVRVEGWTLLGTMLGVFPVVVWTRQTDDGWEARVEARTIAGAVVGAAEAECLRSEKTWAKRDDYALRSMAQTRATSKALRGPLGFVVSLAGFDPTPEEEMPRETTGRATGEPGHTSPTPAAGDDPRKMPAAFADAKPADLVQRLTEALEHVDSTVLWFEVWEAAIVLLYGKPGKDLSQGQTKEAWTRLANVADRLAGGGDFPPRTEVEVQEAFAWAFGDHVVEVLRKTEEES